MGVCGKWVLITRLRVAAAAQRGVLARVVRCKQDFGAFAVVPEIQAELPAWVEG